MYCFSFDVCKNTFTVKIHGHPTSVHNHAYNFKVEAAVKMVTNSLHNFVFLFKGLGVSDISVTVHDGATYFEFTGNHIAFGAYAYCVLMLRNLAVNYPEYAQICNDSISDEEPQREQNEDSTEKEDGEEERP